MNFFTTALSFLCTSLANLLFCPGKEVWVRHLIEAMLKLDHMMFCNWNWVETLIRLYI